MSIFEMTPDSLKALERTDFASQGLRERSDLQRLIRDQIEVLDSDLLVISEEFGDWEESKRRIDLLAVDREANLVVIELKRTESGGHMELQALRYAAMVSTMTFDKAVNIYRDFLQKIGRDDDATSSLLEFLEWDEPDEERFAQDVRVILASADFSKELTTAVMWLNQRELDIRCIRLRPYSDGDRVFLDVQQVIPLPEAAEFQFRVGEKVKRERQIQKAGNFNIIFKGNNYHATSGKEALIKVFELLAQEDKKFLEKFAADPQSRGTTNKYLAKNKEELYPKSPHLALTRSHQIEGWWLATSHGHKAIKRILDEAIEVAGLGPDEISVDIK